MEVEELKARLCALLHQRDMLRYERDSVELDDILQEVEEEIRDLLSAIFTDRCGIPIKVSFDYSEPEENRYRKDAEA